MRKSGRKDARSRAFPPPKEHYSSRYERMCKVALGLWRPPHPATIQPQFRSDLAALHLHQGLGVLLNEQQTLLQQAFPHSRNSRSRPEEEMGRECGVCPDLLAASGVASCIVFLIKIRWIIPRVMHSHLLKCMHARSPSPTVTCVLLVRRRALVWELIMCGISVWWRGGESNGPTWRQTWHGVRVATNQTVIRLDWSR